MRSGMISQGGGGGAGHRQAALRKDIAEQVHEQIFDSSWQPKEDGAKMQKLLHGVRILRAPTASELVKGGPWDAIMVGAGLSGAILAERYGGRMRTRTCACICVWERARAHACETEPHRETQSQTQSQTLTQTQPQTEIQTQTQEAEADAEIETVADRQSERGESACACACIRAARLISRLRPFELKRARTPCRFASTLGMKVLVVEKRDHIGGNCYDFIEADSGLLLNKYGAHLFHTNDKKVQDSVALSGCREAEHDCGISVHSFRKICTLGLGEKKTRALCYQ